jgi:glycosyltransferase involved in cell wall biosynthesis
MSTPLITVAVPSFQQGPFLKEALTSILSQQLPIELMVMDGGSTDNSIEIIQHFTSNLTYWRSHRDKGQSHARHRTCAG